MNASQVQSQENVRLSAQKAAEQLRALLQKNIPLIQLHGCEGSLPSFFLSSLVEQTSSLKRPLLAVVETQLQAQALVRDLQFFLGTKTNSLGDVSGSTQVFHFPEMEVSPWVEATSEQKSLFQRMSLLFRLSQGEEHPLIVASAKALARRVLPKKEFSLLTDVIQAKQEIDREGLFALLAKGGYTRMPICEDVGTFSVHGGVVDIFVPLYPFPVRIEFFGDLVESLRFYEPDTQRTLRSIDEIYVHPIKETFVSHPAGLQKRLLEAGDVASHPSVRTNEMIEQLERGESFLGIEALVPAFHERMDSIFDYFQKKPLVWIQEPHHIDHAFEEQWRDAERMYQNRLSENKLSFPPGEFYLMKEGFDRIRKETGCISVNPLFIEQTSVPDGAAFHSSISTGTSAPIFAEATVSVSSEASAHLQVASSGHETLTAALRKARLEKQEHLLLPWVHQIKADLEEHQKIVIVSPSLPKAERLDSLLRSYGLSARLYRPGIAGLVATKEAGEELHGFYLLEQTKQPGVEIRVGTLSYGFDLPLDRVSIYCESEIFGEKIVRQSTKTKKKTSLSDFQDLSIGSLIVHQTHGIGRYQGLVKLPLKGIEVDFVLLKYEGGNLYLPVWRLSEIKRYVGAEGTTPRLDRLGGETWQKAKGKVSKEIQKLAEELLQVYAKRQALPGVAYHLSESSAQMFAEFEALFPYEETPDQQRAIDEVLHDLEQPRPMDRLICGDVGYGKTEVALRAAMKVVLAGKQVAVLAPTTVLVEQHAARFAERFSNFPVRVRSLSRFRSRKEQIEVLNGLSQGTIDVVVGTHRLLSADVRFKDLGLLIIDEEQRFGVAHKERLRTLRSQLDTLTLSATPIPRTLHMAFSGLREVSIISTPPEDRLAIRTLVVREGDGVIQEAVEKELRRGGQVFFVHNRVETIGKWAKRLHELLPQIKIGMGHGQLPPEELEKVMLDFIEGHTQLLLCTTIIESGLDIPRANTMIIDRADTLGLSQLYQLRGRIGRSKERAYCYLMAPAAEKMTREAKERLSVLQRFTELGSGFAIASQDLEIRGAGDLLGDKQSGTISAVGFDMYTQMLKEAVAELQGQPISKEREPEFTCDLPGFIPDDYIPDPGHRLEFYQRFSAAANEEEIASLLAEMNDRFGPVPDEVGLLSEMMVVKNLSRRLKATAVELSESRFALALPEDTPLSTEQILKLVNAPKSLWRLSPDMRLSRSFMNEAERKDRLALAKKLLRELLLQAES